MAHKGNLILYSRQDGSFLSVYNECISTSLRWSISFKNKFVLAVNTLGSPGTFLADWEDHSYVPENKASKRVPLNACRES